MATAATASASSSSALGAVTSPPSAAVGARTSTRVRQPTAKSLEMAADRERGRRGRPRRDDRSAERKASPSPRRDSSDGEPSPLRGVGGRTETLPDEATGEGSRRVMLTLLDRIRRLELAATPSTAAGNAAPMALRALPPTTRSLRPLPSCPTPPPLVAIAAAMPRARRARRTRRPRGRPPPHSGAAVTTTTRRLHRSRRHRRRHRRRIAIFTRRTVASGGRVACGTLRGVRGASCGVAVSLR